MWQNTERMSTCNKAGTEYFWEVTGKIINVFFFVINSLNTFYNKYVLFYNK